MNITGHNAVIEITTQETFMPTGTQSDPHILPANGQDNYNLAPGEHWFKSQQSGEFSRADVGAQIGTYGVRWTLYGDGSPLDDPDAGYSGNRQIANPGNYSEYTLKVEVVDAGSVQVTLNLFNGGA